MPAAVDVGPVDELVAGGDRELHRPRRVLRRGRETAGEDLRGLTGRERQLPSRGRAARGPKWRLGGGDGGGDLAEQAAGAGVRGWGDGDVALAPGVLGATAL